MHPRAVGDAVRPVLASAGAPWREIGPVEWGLEATAAGRPLHVGVALRGGLVRAQAEVLGAGVADPPELLRRHRRLALVRFSQTRAGAVWAEGAVPPDAGPAAVERLLAELVAAADDLRTAYAG